MSQLLNEPRSESSQISDSLSENDERSSERGYIMAMTALLLIPLMIFAAFAVDVGAWYAQAARTQRAADAAALAAVVWMPGETQATAAALDVAAKNGFVHGVNATITVERQGAQQVKVHIESEGSVYFGAVVMDSITIERFAVAEYILPVPMGNPTSALGTGDLYGGVEGIWLAVNGVCQDRKQGDPFSVLRYNASGTNRCNNDGSYSGSVNDNYDEEGYVYVVDVPPGAGEVKVQLYEPGLCGGTTSDSYGPRLNLRLYAVDDTPLSDQDNLNRPPVADVDFDSNDCDAGIVGDPHWYEAATIPGGNPGRWFLRIRGINHLISGNNSDRVAGLNGFAIRLASNGSTNPCSSLTSANCPQIFAKDWLGLWRPNFGGSPVASFFLAEIDQVHAGKKVEIVLFDPGEGMNNLQIKSPGGVSMPFEFQRYDCGALGTNCSDPDLQTNNTCGGNPCLDVTGSVYNDHAVRLLVDLPASYDCDGETHCWWKIRYDSTGGPRPPTDRTTWSVRVIGDPVRLTE